MTADGSGTPINRRQAFDLCRKVVEGLAPMSACGLIVPLDLGITAMVYAFRLRDGLGDFRLASQGPVPLNALFGRRLSRPYPSLPTYSIGDHKGLANPVSEPNSVAILIDDPAEARLVGATPGRYHVVLDFTPWQLKRMLAANAKRSLKRACIGM